MSKNISSGWVKARLAPYLMYVRSMLGLGKGHLYLWDMNNM